MVKRGKGQREMVQRVCCKQATHAQLQPVLRACISVCRSFCGYLLCLLLKVKVGIEFNGRISDTTFIIIVIIIIFLYFCFFMIVIIVVIIMDMY